MRYINLDIPMFSLNYNFFNCIFQISKPFTPSHYSALKMFK